MMDYHLYTSVTSGRGVGNGGEGFRGVTSVFQPGWEKGWVQKKLGTI